MRDRAAGWIGVALAALPLAACWMPAVARSRSVETVLAVSADPPGAAHGADARPLADGALDRIIEAVQKRYNARVVKVTEVMVGGKRAYELRLLSDQRVWTVRVDADSGQELSRE